VNDNELQKLSPAIASLVNLETLDISKNGIQDLTDSIKSCKKLSFVEASVNPLGR
jgi:Leucine-rich repeat (LRR) protein